MDFAIKMTGVSKYFGSQVAVAERLLDWVGLLPFKDRVAEALSGGMRQKLP